jgi:hypothetical protein
MEIKRITKRRSKERKKTRNRLEKYDENAEK